MTSALLTKSQQQACKQHATASTVDGKRARALLAVHGGASQAQAAAESGLTLGQVRYWLAKFRRDGLAIFPNPTRPAAATPTKRAVSAKATSKTRKVSGSASKGKSGGKAEKRGKKQKPKKGKKPGKKSKSDDRKGKGKEKSSKPKKADKRKKKSSGKGGKKKQDSKGKKRKGKKK